jgi:LacI family transcriptional regulator
VLSRGLIDGVIISSSLEDDPLIPRLLESNMPFVVHGRPLVEAPVNYVDVDNTVGAHNAVSHLIRLGRRRIGHIAGPLNTAVGRDRRQGYINAHLRRGVPVDDDLIVVGDFSETGGYRATRRLVERGVDALFAASDTMAFGALRMLREMGRRVPDDVAVVGFDDLEPATLTQPPLTTVRQPTRQTGTAAVETLLDIVENGDEPVRRVIMPTQLIIRQSCGASFQQV